MPASLPRLFAPTLVFITLIGPLAVHLFLPAIPVVKQELGISNGLAQLTFTVSLVAMAISTLVYGRVADNWGRRPALLSGLVLFLIGSALSAVAQGIEMLLIGRLVQAAGAGCGLTLARAIARDAYGQDQLVRVIAYITMFYTLGPIFAPAVGGFLIDYYGWRTLFEFAIVAGGAILALAAMAIPETRPPQNPGSVKTPLLTVYRDLFSRGRFVAFVMQTGLSTGTFFVAATAAAFFMKEQLQRPASEFGLYFMLFPTGFMLGTFMSARIGNRIGIETMVLSGSLIVLLSVSVQILLLSSGSMTPLTLSLPGFFITFGQGIELPSSQAGAIATAPKHAGTAAGVGVCVQMLIGGLAPQLYGFVANGTLEPYLISIAACALATITAGSIPMYLRHRTAASAHTIS